MLTSSLQPTRRHDLDALRAFAMLLGIALHAALAFVPIPWIAMNDETVPALGTFVELVHGFRLPLFFLMSGFFAAMLIHRRGLGGFVRHRWKRIALPLLLGTITIVPAMWAVIIGGSMLSSAYPPPQRQWGGDLTTEATIWSAAASGDIPTVRELLDAGASPNTPDPRVGTLPLAWAVTGDHAEITAILLKAGADPNQRMINDNTPLHTACFFGASESVPLMLDAGADPTLTNTGGETPIDSMRHDRGAVEYIANLLGVSADFDRVVDGREQITAMLEADGLPNQAPDPARPLERLVDFALTGDLFMHLWFLWHLCWLAGGLVLVTLVVRRLSPRMLPGVLVRTPLCLVLLLPLTALTQSWQAAFGPDTSSSLIPAPHVLGHYAVFFAFGALMHAASGAADRLGRVWWAWMLIAVLAAIPGLRLTHDASAFAGYTVDDRLGSVLAAVLQSVFVWATAFAFMGLARRLLARPSPRIRYLSDASYWLYIAHLPLVIAGQFALAYLPWPPLLEFGILTAAVTLVLLVCYQTMVRYTVIGRLLNGPRTRAPGEPDRVTVSGPEGGSPCAA